MQKTGNYYLSVVTHTAGRANVSTAWPCADSMRARIVDTTQELSADRGYNSRAVSVSCLRIQSVSLCHPGAKRAAQSCVEPYRAV